MRVSLPESSYWRTWRSSSDRRKSFRSRGWCSFANSEGSTRPRSAPCSTSVISSAPCRDALAALRRGHALEPAGEGGDPPELLVLPEQRDERLSAGEVGGPVGRPARASGPGRRRRRGPRRRPGGPGPRRPRLRRPSCSGRRSGSLEDPGVAPGGRSFPSGRSSSSRSASTATAAAAASPRQSSARRWKWREAPAGGVDPLGPGAEGGVHVLLRRRASPRRRRGRSKSSSSMQAVASRPARFARGRPRCSRCSMRCQSGTS